MGLFEISDDHRELVNIEPGESVTHIFPVKAIRQGNVEYEFEASYLSNREIQREIVRGEIEIQTPNSFRPFHVTGSADRSGIPLSSVLRQETGDGRLEYDLLISKFPSLLNLHRLSSIIDEEAVN